MLCVCISETVITVVFMVTKMIKLSLFHWNNIYDEIGMTSLEALVKKVL